MRHTVALIEKPLVLQGSASSCSRSTRNPPNPCNMDSLKFLNFYSETIQYTPQNFFFLLMNKASYSKAFRIPARSGLHSGPAPPPAEAKPVREIELQAEGFDFWGYRV